MKTLTPTIESIARNVSCHAAVYAAARPKHPALAPYETIADVLAALGQSSPLSTDERDPILIAVATEHQRTRHALWQAILLKSFAPRLLFLRKRQGKPLEAARSIRTESHIARCLRIVTEAKVYESERKARRHGGTEEFNDELQYPSVFGPSTHTKIAANEVLDIIEAEGGPELRNMTFATRALDETITDYVARHHGRKASAERAAIADRLRRNRINVLLKLGARVERKEQTRGLASTA